MLRIFAIAIGTIFIAFAIISFMPEFVKENKLFGIFAINTYHNLLHLGLGILGTLCGLRGTIASRYFFIGLGIGYGIMALFGIYNDTIALFRYIATNSADTWLRGAISALSLYIAITFSRKKLQD